MPDQWTVIVPIKPLGTAKTRLGRRDTTAPLAMAFAQDAITAALGAPGVEIVVVATSDPDVTAWATGQGAQAIDDTGYPGINPAIEHAAAELGAGAVAAMLSDLPSLTPAALGGVLNHARHHPCAFLPDHSGTGTTIWTRTTPGPVPHFGTNSAQAHRTAGAFDLSTRFMPEWTGARLDVDTLEDLERALGLGVGPHTHQALNP